MVISFLCPTRLNVLPMSLLTGKLDGLTEVPLYGTMLYKASLCAQVSMHTLGELLPKLNLDLLPISANLRDCNLLP